MKSTLFLMEQLVSILIFAVCAAVCVRIFVSSYIMSVESEQLNNALIIAKNGAECYKAAYGDVNKAVSMLGGGQPRGEDGIVYYDGNMMLCPPDEAEFILRITPKSVETAPVSLLYADISIETSDAAHIFKLQAAARRENE